MRIIWNQKEGSFDLEFDKNNWASDLEYAKAAKFKTTGPPDWTWYAVKTTPLSCLRENRPPSGLIITEEALAKYNEKKAEEDKTAAIVKEFKDTKARLEGKPTEDEKAEKRKKQEEARIASGKPKKVKQARGGSARSPRDESTPRVDTPIFKYVPPPPPETKCIYCLFPVYSYEKLEPLPVCLWCEKTIADKQSGEHEFS